MADEIVRGDDDHDDVVIIKSNDSFRWADS